MSDGWVACDCGVACVFRRALSFSEGWVWVWSSECKHPKRERHELVLMTKNGPVTMNDPVTCTRCHGTRHIIFNAYTPPEPCPHCVDEDAEAHADDIVEHDRLDRIERDDRVEVPPC